MYLRLLITTNLLVFVLFNFSFAQGKIVFTEDNFDFGNIIEGTIATHEFHFVNKGNEPIIISNVQASCGCTTPYWTKDPVLPGNKGTIKASYNSHGRPGAFTKTITITSNAENPSMMLTLKGMVNEKPLISPSAKAKFETNVYDLGKIVKGKKTIKNVSVTNSGDAILNILSLKSSCNCITYKSLPSSLKPGESTTIELAYIPKQIGTFNEPVVFTTNDKNTAEVRVYLKSEVNEDNSLNSVVKESKSNIPFN